MADSTSNSIETSFPHLPPGEFWVFGYGSLMWRPDFGFIEKRDACLPGYRRSLCVWSWHHRGTRENPGLVFGLDDSESSRGVKCQGCVYRVSAKSRIATLEYLKERELITDVYQPAVLDTHTDQGNVTALTFVVDKNNAQYAGNLDAEESANIVRASRGKSGENADYVLSTWRYLKACNIEDEQLRAVCEYLS